MKPNDIEQWNIFAAAALTGITANPKLTEMPLKEITDWSARLADGMMKENEKRLYAHH